jgi:hypothetical protein
MTVTTKGKNNPTPYFLEFFRLTTSFAQAGSNPMQPENKGTPRQDPGQQDDPECWGEVTSGLATENKGIGEHVRDPVDNLSPHDTPRTGIGNMPEDTPAEHGLVVGPLFGQECQDPRDE